MKVVLKCKGYQQKLFPYDKQWQAACLEIMNEPNLVRIINCLLTHQVAEDDIHVYQDYMPEQVSGILQQYPDIHLENGCHDFRDFLWELTGEANTQVLIIQADHVFTDDDLAAILVGQGNNCALLTEKVKPAIETMGAKVENTQIQYFLGHPREHYVTHQSAGAYLLDQMALNFVINSSNGFDRRISGSMIPDEFFIENGLNAFIESGNMLHPVFANHQVFTLQFPWDILNANEYHLMLAAAALEKNDLAASAVIDERASINGFIKLGKNSVVGKNVVIDGNVIIGNNVKVDDGAILRGNILVGDDSIITEYAKIEGPSVIGRDNKIGHCAEFSGMTMRGVSMAHYCEMSGIIGRYVDVGAASVCGGLRFNDAAQPQKINGRIYLDKNTNGVFIGDFTRTGVNNTFFPGVKIGCNCALYPGVNIESDVPHETLLIKKEETIEKRWGPEKYGW